MIARTNYPILFTKEMIWAIYRNMKCETRRPVMPQPTWQMIIAGPGLYNPVAYDRNKDEVPRKAIYGVWDESDGEWAVKCPYGSPRGTLWVKETFYVRPDAWKQNHEEQLILYNADINDPSEVAGWVKKPSIYMPYWACRTKLLIHDIQVERIFTMTEIDAINEGMLVLDDNFLAKHFSRYIHEYNHWKISEDGAPPLGPNMKERFARLWDSINEHRTFCAWAFNPLVWVIKFSPIQLDEKVSYEQEEIY